MKQPNKKQLHNFAKYSSMAFQMGIIVFASAFGGVKLDEYISSMDFPLFTITLTIFGVFAAVYISIKDFINTDKN
ncbi:MAG: hypothetical protein AUJ98_06390 [Bacteroidetes bacterium CG2_30_33_31]|nr:MAG: hypothetical protein AUJ98_06390 [Bacteroidetes bacterium CG2_30_33_31]